MVTFTDKDLIKAGVPLGGIGTGKLEFDNKVNVVNVTIANNWNNPIKKLEGFHVYIKTDDEEFFAQKITSFYPSADEIIYEGKYPFVTITAKRKGVKVKIEAFSSLIPHDLKNSSLPSIGIKISVYGSNKGLVAISFPNIVGSLNIGRINRKINGGVLHDNLKANDYDPRKGNVCLITDHEEKVITQFSLNEEIKGWKEGINNPHEVTGMADLPASIIYSSFDKEGEEIKYVLSWYFVGRHVFYPYGHYYFNFFKDSQDVAKYFMENFDFLEKKTKEWQNELPSDWLGDAIINSAYILSTNTWLDEKGRFGILESSIVCPCMGTIGTCYEFGSLPIIKFFPELEKSFLSILASYQREDGYIPHDLGFYSFDSPIDGTSAPPKWKDMVPTFILLVYRYYKFTQDREFINSVYPALVKALYWEFKTLKDDLPYLEGKFDSAFDATPIKGHSSYVASLYIASLLAMKEIAKLMNDEKILTEVEERLKKAREKFNSMFNGKYFIAWDGMNASFTAQVFGEWWARLLNLEPITDKEKIISALKSIVEINGKASPYCVPNLVRDDGKVVPLSIQTYSSWPRMTFAICWLAYKYNVEGALTLCEKEWNNLVKQGLVWDQPSRISSINGKPDPFEGYLDHYIGSPAIWSFLF